MKISKRKQNLRLKWIQPLRAQVVKSAGCSSNRPAFGLQQLNKEVHRHLKLQLQGLQHLLASSGTCTFVVYRPLAYTSKFKFKSKKKISFFFKKLIDIFIKSENVCLNIWFYSIKSPTFIQKFFRFPANVLFLFQTFTICLSLFWSVTVAGLPLSFIALTPLKDNGWIF